MVQNRVIQGEMPWVVNCGHANNNNDNTGPVVQMANGAEVLRTSSNKDDWQMPLHCGHIGLTSTSTMFDNFSSQTLNVFFVVANWLRAKFACRYSVPE